MCGSWGGMVYFRKCHKRHYVIVVSVLLSRNHNGRPREGHIKPTLMQINSLWVAALWLLSGVMMGHHFKSVSVATFNENAVLGTCLSTWAHVFCRRAGNLIHFISPPCTPPSPQFKNFMFWCLKENHLVFFLKNQPRSADHYNQVQLQHFFFKFILQEIAAQSGKTLTVASPHRPTDVTFLKQFLPLFFFLEDFGLRQCCKSILLSPNVSRWMRVEAVKVNDRSLTHSWWFQVEEKKRKKKKERN